jgi:mannose-6-phosphate isomerase-like protein (cupin superfamily)
MEPFVTRSLTEEPDTTAPDGMQVRLLAAVENHGSMAHFTLQPGQVSRAGVHRTVSEIWYFVSGMGRMWRRQGERDSTVKVHAGVSITIPVGTCFQCRNDGTEPLSAVGFTMPPWPGDGEWRQVEGVWKLNV